MRFNVGCDLSETDEEEDDHVISLPGYFAITRYFGDETSETVESNANSTPRIRSAAIMETTSANTMTWMSGVGRSILWMKLHYLGVGVIDRRL